MMIKNISEPLVWFPYTPRPHQEEAIAFASEIFNEKTTGILSAACGVGKTIATLSGYAAVRQDMSDSRLFILTRTHSQARVFEEEIEVLRSYGASFLTVTSMVSRSHICPLKSEIESQTSSGFLRGCAMMIRTGRCRFYWSFYRRHGDSAKPVIRDRTRTLLRNTMDHGVINRELVEEIGRRESVCSYELLRWAARNSRVIIGPYSYLFRRRIRQAMLNSLGLELFDIDLVVDEAHNLPEHVLDIESSKLSGKDLRWLRENKKTIEQQSRIGWMGEYVEFLWDTMQEKMGLFSLKRKEIPLDTWDVIPRFVSAAQMNTLMNEKQIFNENDGMPSETPFDRLLDFIFTGGRAAEGEDWHITVRVGHPWNIEHISIDDIELLIRPLNAAGLITPVLRGAKSAFLMSGTLRPTNLYASLMGIRGTKAKDLASPYPNGTRLLLLENRLSTKFTERSPKQYRQLAERVSLVMTAMPADKSALIAFPSYRMMNEILSYNIECGFRHRIVESRHAQISDLKIQIEAEPCAVFLVYGGKFSEGVDFVQDGSSLINLIVGVGIPFGPPTSYQKALQNWYEGQYGEGTGFYYGSVVPSIRRVVQLVGRLRRSPSDWGAVLLLDRRFRKYVNMFGPDATHDIWPYSSPSEITEAIDAFIEKRRGMS